MDDMETLFERRRDALLALGAVLVLLLLLGRVLVDAGAPSVSTPVAVSPAVPVAPAPPAEVVVDVAGAVTRPGLYRMQQGQRVADAVAKAGGPSRKADLEQINLAALLADGEQIVVPRRGAAPLPVAGAVAKAGPVRLSTASVEELDSLPGVGPVTAGNIIAYREQHGAFRSVEELDAIPGIGMARLEQLKELVRP